MRRLVAISLNKMILQRKVPLLVQIIQMSRSIKYIIAYCVFISYISMNIHQSTLFDYAKAY